MKAAPVLKHPIKREEFTVTRALLAATAVKLGIKRPSWWGTIAEQQELPLDVQPQVILGSEVVREKTEGEKMSP